MKILYFFLFSFLFIACNTPVINKNDVVAEVNGEQILLSELASQSKQEIFDILNTAYEIKSRVLAGLIKQQKKKTCLWKSLSIGLFSRKYV